MLKKIIKHTLVISFASLLLFLNNGCEKASQNNEAAQTKTEAPETKPLVIPQYESIETPEYRRLKKEVEKARHEVNELQAERDSLLVKYTEEYFPVKKVSSELKAAQKKLYQLEELLAEESKKLEYKPKNAPV